MNKNGVQQLAQVVKKYRTNWPLPTKLIGKGGYGKVYNTNNGRVMKITTNNASKEFNMLKQLKSAHYVPHVRNGNFVRLNGKNNNVAGIFGGYYDPSVFIMNKVGGSRAMTLRTYRQEYGKSVNANALNRRLTNALSNLQVRGVLHRNLHGGNIIVSTTPSGKITGLWVIDFGLARHIAKNGYSAENLWTAHHMLKRKTPWNGDNLAKKLGKRRTEIRENLKLLTNSKKRVGRSKSASPPRRNTTTRKRSS
jgi:RIO-like serine/threonine protein kinase